MRQWLGEVLRRDHVHGGEGTALEDWAKCPVCQQELSTTGPDGVMVHLLAIHSDSTEARWVMNQLGELARQLSG